MACRRQSFGWAAALVFLASPLYAQPTAWQIDPQDDRKHKRGLRCGG
jgi:hypothetical protein